MLLFRIICAVLTAWAMSFALSRPESAALLEEVPEFEYLGPLAGAIVGYMNLSVRQGWGIIVGVANGIWTGVLTLALSCILFVIFKMGGSLGRGIANDFDGLTRIIGAEVDPVLAFAVDFPFMLTVIGATAVVGIVSEGLHWTLVKLRERDQDNLI